jgi:hypothetical protein
MPPRFRRNRQGSFSDQGISSNTLRQATLRILLARFRALHLQELRTNVEIKCDLVLLLVPFHFRCEGFLSLKRVFEKFYLGASRLSMRRMAAKSMKASEVWTFN